MTTKKAKPSSISVARRRRIDRLERKLLAVEAQIARLERDKHLGLAQQDHFALWHRSTLFVSLHSDGLH